MGLVRGKPRPPEARGVLLDVGVPHGNGDDHVFSVRVTRVLITFSGTLIRGNGNNLLPFPGYHELYLLRTIYLRKIP